MIDRRRVEKARRTPHWGVIAVGALVAGILAAGVGRAVSLTLPRDSEAAGVTQIVIALVVACGAGLTLGTSDLLRDRWHTLRRK